MILTDQERILHELALPMKEATAEVWQPVRGAHSRELQLACNHKVVAMDKEAFSIGRLPCCDVRTQEDNFEVSRMQCWVFNLPCAIVVVDGWSLCGTLLLDDEDHSNVLPASSLGQRRVLLIPHDKPATLRLADGVEVTFNPKLCVVCMARPRGAQLPCGHQVLCLTCAGHVGGAMHACPMCRKRIEATGVRRAPRAVNLPSYAAAVMPVPARGGS
mmetsp:Transcript_34858/g.110726  ORF Transcript_34858/g.110726 Transcript_34858/m.110726 type:complete len:216 (-) Transcript_34858:164-811(-)